MRIELIADLYEGAVVAHLSGGLVEFQFGQAITAANQLPPSMTLVSLYDKVELPNSNPFNVNEIFAF